MTNEQLVARIKAGENVSENMEALYIQVRSFIHTIAWKYRGCDELEDLEQEGYLALYPAIDGYDPDHGVKFLTYADYHIRQQIRRHIQNNGSCLRLPIHCLERMMRYKRFRSEFEVHHGRRPTDGESAEFLGLSMDQIRDIRERDCMVNLESLDSLAGGREGEGTPLADMLKADVDIETMVLEKVQARQLKRDLWTCVDALEGRQPDVVRRRYQDNMTLEAIGRIYGITPGVVRDVERQALRELRKPRHSKRLRPYLEEIRSRAMTGVGIRRFHETWTSATERLALEGLETWRKEPQNTEKTDNKSVKL